MVGGIGALRFIRYVMRHRDRVKRLNLASDAKIGTESYACNPFRRSIRVVKDLNFSSNSIWYQINSFTNHKLNKFYVALRTFVVLDPRLTEFSAAWAYNPIVWRSW